MDRNQVMETLNEIARDVFDNESVVLTDTTTAADVEEWDSLTHLSLISDVEDAFDVTLTLGEIQGSANVGELVDALLKHIGENER